LMTLEEGQAPVVRHVELAPAPQTASAPQTAGTAPFEPWVDLAAGFGAAHARYLDSILAPELRGPLAGLRPDMFEDAQAVLEAVLPLSHACWAGEREWITREALWGVLGEEERGVLAEMLESGEKT